MKPLVIILGCHKRPEHREAQRQTWLKNLKCDYKFILGRRDTPGSPREDELWFDVDDGYRALPYKVRAACEYAELLGYTNIFKADDDTYVFPERLLASDYSAYEYIGFFANVRIPEAWRRLWFMPPEENIIMACGDAGYWIGPEMISAIQTSEIWMNLFNEDCRTGLIARNIGIEVLNDHRYIPIRGVNDYHQQATCPDKIDDVISIAEFGPAEMIEYHKAPHLNAIQK